MIELSHTWSLILGQYLASRLPRQSLMCRMNHWVSEDKNYLRPYMDTHNLPGIQLLMMNWFRLQPYIRITIGRAPIPDGIR